jgi:ATPase subunit of ABC transporter with duplicated ATPase domains
LTYAVQADPFSESINALNIALQRYDGTVLLVTRDHDVIDEVASRIWSFADGAIEDFKGTFELKPERARDLLKDRASG